MRLIIKTREKLTDEIIQRIFNNLLNVGIFDDPMKISWQWWYYFDEDVYEPEPMEFLRADCEEIEGLGIEQIEEICIDDNTENGLTLYMKNNFL